MTDQEKNDKLAAWLGVPKGMYNFLTSIADAWMLVGKMNVMYTFEDDSPEEEIATTWAGIVGPLYSYKTAEEAALSISNAVLEVI